MADQLSAMEQHLEFVAGHPYSNNVPIGIRGWITCHTPREWAITPSGGELVSRFTMGMI